MVKNSKGGNKAKSMARKGEREVKSSYLRLSANEYEKYARVTKALGHGMFHVTTIDGEIDMLLHIRGKFVKNKRSNLVSKGNYVLIGLRDYEKPTFKNSDLLEIYSDDDVKRLSKMPDLTSFFEKEIESTTGECIDGIEFTTKEIIVETNEPLGIRESIEEEEINIDDI
jgi:translation initiation factor IF-1